MRACGPGEFRASLEAQLLMVARRLSHRVVAIGLFPPSSDSWHPTHSTHKFTRATASGESNFHSSHWLLRPIGDGRSRALDHRCPTALPAASEHAQHHASQKSKLPMRAVEPWRQMVPLLAS